jgi:ribose transport system substrate-binding protein
MEIITIDGDTAMGALAACESQGRSEIIIAGYDATPEQNDIIRAGGQIKASAALHPERIGRTAIDTVAKILRGENYESYIQTPITLVTIDNVDTFEKEVSQ